MSGLTLEIRLGSAAMHDASDVTWALDRVEQKIAAGQRDGTILDINGNTVGRWQLTLPAYEYDCPGCGEQIVYLDPETAAAREARLHVDAGEPPLCAPCAEDRDMAEGLI